MTSDPIRGTNMRQHPARAMYDQIEPLLTSITMQLRSAIYADVNMPSRVDGKKVSGPLRRASGWARNVAAELGSLLLDTLGLAATIEWHLQQFQKCTGIPYELTVNNAAHVDLPEEYAATIFDVYSEALSNVARHTEANQVAIALTITPREVTLVVRDNGMELGEEAIRSRQYSIALIRARVQSHDGLCEFACAPNAGTTVKVSLPIARAS